MTDHALNPGWKVWRFDQIAVNVADRVEPGDVDVDYYVGLEHLDSDSLKIRRWGEPSDVEATKLLFQKGDIIFGRRRVYQRKLAVAEFDGICSAHAMVLRPKTDVVLPEFLPFFMQSDLFMDRALEISVGSLSPTINWRTLARQEFALPPLAEQREVVKMAQGLEDATVHYLEHRVSLEQLFRITLHRWLSVISEAGKEARFEFGELPCECRIRRMGQVATCVVPGRTKPKSFSGEIPWVTTPDITSTFVGEAAIANYVSRDELDAVGGKVVPKGSVLMTCVGELGITALAERELSFNQQIHAFLSSEALVPQYLVYALRAQKRQMLSRAASTTVPYLNRENCEAIFIPVPTLDTQIEIAYFLTATESSATLAQKRAQHLSEIKRQALSQAMS